MDIGLLTLQSAPGWKVLIAQSREGKGCWTGEEKFLLWFYFSGMNRGREGIKNVERRLWE